MDVPFARWYAAIPDRRSRRNFDISRPLETDLLAALDKVCNGFRPFPHARTCLVNEPKLDVFKNILGIYGKVRGTGAFIAFVGDMRGYSVQEEVGYTGEGVILEATALGLNTCWVGGFFKPASVASLLELTPEERVLAVSPVGYALDSETLQERLLHAFVRHGRLPVSHLVSNPNRLDHPTWIKPVIEAARLAPSATNRQPWGFTIQDDGILVYERTRTLNTIVSRRLDCGISMLHLEVAAGKLGIKGRWQFLESPRVAKFAYLSG